MNHALLIRLAGRPDYHYNYYNVLRGTTHQLKAYQ